MSGFRIAGTRPERRGSRGRLALWSAVPSLVLLAVAVKFLSVAPLAGQAGHAFENNDAPALSGAAAGLGQANWLEPHKAFFAAGDSGVLAGDFAAARMSFEQALAVAPPSDICKVRVNLLLSIEKLGDAESAAGRSAEAAGLFREGIELVAGSPEGCFAAGNAGNREGEGERLKEGTERLDGKLKGNGKQDTGNSKDVPREGGDQTSQDQLKNLEESGRTARKERADGETRDEYLRSPDSGPEVDKPW